MWLSIGEAVEHWARYKANNIALIIDNKEISYNMLYYRAISIAGYLSDNKIHGRIGIAVKSKFEYLSCIVASNILRLPVIIFNPHPTQESLNVHIEDTKPAIIICHNQLIDPINNASNGSLRIQDIDEIPQVNQSKISVEVSSNEWGVLFSSGSTGISKAIVYEHSTMTSELLAWCLELGIRQDTKFYVGRPIYYTGGLVLTLATLLVGGQIIFPEEQYDNNFKEIWDHYQNYLSSNSVNFAFFAPDQLRTFMRIATNPLGGPTILVMGSPISGDEKISANQKLRSPIIESWGNSEGLGTITDVEDLDIRPESIGRPFLTEKLFIVNDGLEKCDAGKSGRIAGSDETMFVKYANRPYATKLVKQNNFILSDDIGYMDQDHYFYILGRNQESFIINGDTIFLVDIEQKLRNVPGILEVCIAAVESEDNSPSFHALFVTHKDKLEDSIRKEVEKKIPVQLEKIILVDSLPRLSSGKIDRMKAVELVTK